ncbi:MAG: CRISPR-associated protein Cas4 [Thermoplasmatota archaeon]
MTKEWISASDVEKYGYCPLSWWLSHEEQEVMTQELKKGREDHEEIGEKLEDVKRNEETSKGLENIVLWLAVAASLISVSGLTLLQPEEYLHQIFIVTGLIWLLAATFFLFMSESGRIKGEKLTAERIILIFAMGATILAVYSLTLRFANMDIARITQLVSLSWLIGASYWLKRSLDMRKEAKSKRDELHIQEGEIEYVDGLKEKSRLLESEEYHLRGRPDYIMNIEGEKIPVEVKTGRVPKGPFFSHILQIASYCLLVEEDTGKAPSYGIVKYGDKEFEIDYDDKLKELLVEKLNEMRQVIITEDAHRHHNREGKCRNCSRKDICPESLV